MKFVSKNLNLRIVLYPGTEGNRLDGQPAKPGLYVKFEAGVANVEDEKLIDMMLKHPGFNYDFIKVDEGELDPYAGQRRSSEHEHDNIEIEYGRIGRNANPKKPTVTPEMRKIAVGLAREMATDMAREMVREALAEAKENNRPTDEGEAKKAVSDKRGPGRPKKSESKPFKKPEEDKPETSQD